MSPNMDVVLLSMMATVSRLDAELVVGLCFRRLGRPINVLTKWCPPATTDAPKSGWPGVVSLSAIFWKEAEIWNCASCGWKHCMRAMPVSS